METIHRSRDPRKSRSLAAAAAAAASLVWMLVPLLSLPSAGAEDKELLFSFITTLTGDFVSSGAIPMVDLALEQINNHTSEILPGYKLAYTSVPDSQCNHIHALEAFFQHFQNTSQPTYITSFCCGCSVATEPVAEISHFWNVPQMSFSSGSHVLNDRSHFPSFFRTTPSFEHLASALVVYMEEFNWTQLAVITQSERNFLGIQELLEGLFSKKSGWRLRHVVIPSNLQEDFHYEKLFDYDENEDYRIVFINTYEGYAARVLCEANFTLDKSKQYVWITHGFYDESWWLNTGNSTCSDSIMQSMVNRSLAIIPDGYLLKPESNKPTISGLNEESFEEEYERRLNSPEYSSMNLHEASDAGLAFDATWAIAKGLNNTQRRVQSGDDSGCEHVSGSLVPLEDFNYTNHKMGCVLTQAFAEVQFEGVTGTIVYDHNGSRQDHIVDLEQYRLTSMSDHDDVLKTVAYNVLDSSAKVYYVDNESVQTIWLDDNAPYDGAYKEVAHLNELSLIVIYSILASLGLCYALACLLFNFIFRKRRIVKLTSPNLNYLVISGAVLMYTCVYFFVFDSGDAQTKTILCNVRQWVFSVGYSLCFGVVLAKTWRVYYIFNKPSLKKNKNLIKDWVLLLIVLGIVLVDATILLVGTSVPQSRLNATSIEDLEHETNVNEDGENEDQYILVCVRNATAWLAVSYAYKGLLQILAMFMAFHVRNVKIKALNDTAQIVVIVYINSIILITTMVSDFLISSYHNAYAATFSLGLIIGATIFLSLIFIPKMISLYRDPNGENVFTYATTNENGAVARNKQDTDINLTGGQSNVEKSSDLNDSTSGLRARVSYLEKKLAEAEKKLHVQVVNGGEQPPEQEQF